MAGGFSLDVYKERIARAQAEMARQGLDYLMVGPGSDLFYLTGYEAHDSERMNLLVIPQSGPVSIVVPVLEAPLFRGRESLATVHQWEETKQPAEVVAAIVGNAAGKKVGIGDTLRAVFLIRLQNHVGGAAWQSGNDVMRQLRMQKDAAEIETLQRVATLTDEAFMEFIETAQITGLTETQAMNKLAALMDRRGLAGSFGICASGPNSASPHHHTGDRVIQRGDVVIFDWGGTIDGYHSDITRTVVIGEPSDEVRKVYDIVRRANQAALDAAKPGVACEEIDKAARGLITAEGYGQYFLHRTGHGLGLDVHEEPYMVGGNRLALEPGMVFSDEPGIYMAGKFGVRIEDIVYCTETGAKRFNEATRDLMIMD